MDLIAGAELRRRLAEEPPLLSGLTDPGTQVQMNGVDLTLAEVGALGSRAGESGLRQQRRGGFRDRSPIPPGDGRRMAAGVRAVTGCATARRSTSRRMSFAIGRTRSSLLRCGAHIGTALWDSGYSGRSGSLLVVSHPDGLELTEGARILQLVFFRLSAPAERTYSGVFQNE